MKGLVFAVHVTICHASASNKPTKPSLKPLQQDTFACVYSVDSYWMWAAKAAAEDFSYVLQTFTQFSVV